MRLGGYRMGLAGVVMSLVAMPTGASAAIDVVSGGGFKYVKKSFQLRPGGPRTTKAPCPPGTHVLAGGHYNGGTFGRVIGAHSYPYDDKDRRSVPDDGWAAQLRAFGSGTPAEVHATCAPLAAEYFKNRLTVPDNPNSTPFVNVDCDPGSLSVAGGGTRGHHLVREVSGAPFDGNSWSTELVNKSGEEREITAFGICAAHPFALPSVFPPDPNAPPGTQSNSIMGCAQATPHLVGGGHILGNDGKPDMAISATHPSNIRPGPDTWRVWLDNYGSQSVSYRVTTVCSARLN